MSYGIRFVAHAGTHTRHGPSPISGMWLMSYNPDAMGGVGDTAWTWDVQKAMKFVTMRAAMACYRLQSSVRPTDHRGKPNCPLTAFTIECVEVP